MMKYKVLKLAALLTVGLFYSTGNAQKPEIEVNSIINRGLNAGALDATLKPEIPNNIMMQAEAAYKAMSKKNLPLVETFKNAMSFDNKTGAITFNNIPDIPTTKKGGRANPNDYFDEDERLYIFISSSMPSELLDTYSRDIDALEIGRNAVFVIRGCVPGGGFNGCKDFKPTIDFIKSFMFHDDRKEARKNQLWIDPLLFQRYGVTEVPSFVYAKGVRKDFDMGSEGDFSRLTGTPDWKKSTGDWSVSYHLKELKSFGK